MRTALISAAGGRPGFIRVAPLPIGGEERALLAAVRRPCGPEHRPKAALMPEHLTAMASKLDHSAKDGARNAALVLVGFASGPAAPTWWPSISKTSSSRAGACCCASAGGGGHGSV